MGDNHPIAILWGSEDYEQHIGAAITGKGSSSVGSKEQLNLAQNRMKKYTNRKRREVEFEVGDMVYRKIQLYHRRSLSRNIVRSYLQSFLGLIKSLNE